MTLTNLQIDFAKKTVGLDNFVGDEGPFRYFSQDVHIFRMKGNDGEAKAFYATQPVGMRFTKKTDLKKMKIYIFDQLMTDVNRKVNTRIRNKSKRIENLEERLNDAESTNDRSIEERVTFWLSLAIVLGALIGSIVLISRSEDELLSIEEMRNLLIAITSASVTYVFFQSRPNFFGTISKFIKGDSPSSNGEG